MGRGGALPWDIPEDRAHFFDATRGATLVHGRRVLEELGGRPLAHCRTIVLSRRAGFEVKGARVAASLSAALAMCEEAEGGEEDEEEVTVWIGGGAEVYREALPLASRLVLTVVHNYEAVRAAERIAERRRAGGARGAKEEEGGGGTATLPLPRRGEEEDREEEKEEEEEDAAAVACGEEELELEEGSVDVAYFPAEWREHFSRELRPPRRSSDGTYEYSFFELGPSD